MICHELSWDSWTPFMNVHECSWISNQMCRLSLSKWTRGSVLDLSLSRWTRGSVLGPSLSRFTRSDRERWAVYKPDKVRSFDSVSRGECLLILISPSSKCFIGWSLAIYIYIIYAHSTTCFSVRVEQKNKSCCMLVPISWNVLGWPYLNDKFTY